jgi:hypothetical protein
VLAEPNAANQAMRHCDNCPQARAKIAMLGDKFFKERPRAPIPEPMEQAHTPVWQKRLARWSGKGLAAVLWVVAVPVVLMIAVITADKADSQVGGPRWFGAHSPVWAYRVPLVMPGPAPCAGALCGVYAVVPGVQTLPATKGYVSTTAVLQLPPVLTLNAPEGGFLQVLGWSKTAPPVLTHKANAADEVTLSAGSLVLANLMLGDATKPFTVEDEGYVLDWALLDDAPGSEPRRWLPNTQGASHRAKTVVDPHGESAWSDRKLRTLRFQPVPRTIELAIATVHHEGSIPVGQVAVLSWSTTPPSTHASQHSPDRGTIGVVRAVREQEGRSVLSVELPRETPYGGSGHWLTNRMQHLGADVAVLPPEVRVEFFAPTQSERETGPQEGLGRAAFSRLENQYVKLPRVAMKVVPASALDFECAVPRASDHACLWAAVEGVAVPVQVTVWHRDSAKAFVQERSAFAGKPVTAAHWAVLPSSARRQILRNPPPIRDQVPVALKPLPLQAAGQPLGTVVRKL